jgi:hypothetical protein
MSITDGWNFSTGRSTTPSQKNFSPVPPEDKKELTMRGQLLTGLIVLLAAAIVVTLLLTQTSVNQLGVKGTEHTIELEQYEDRSPRPMPVVENYFAKGWDFRARNTEEQVFVLTTAEESFESKLFKIGSAINLCAHLGYAPPIIFVDALRTTDSEVPETCQDLPELIQDIFPKLRVISVSNPEKLIDRAFPRAMNLQGKFKRESIDKEDFSVFPKFESTTIILSGSWESWEYVDDYRPALFEQLEFHPVIYHHCRKVYPMFFDRRTPIRGVFIGGAHLPVEDIRRFIHRSPIDQEKIVIFLDENINHDNQELQGLMDELKERVFVISGEPKHVQIYLGVMCKEMLIDLSALGWWVGFHAVYRGKPVYYSEPVTPIPLIEHFLHPLFRSNKN